MKEKEHDLCIECGEDTGYDKDTHIAERKYYIQGCGQLCRKCYMQINPESSKNFKTDIDY